MNDDTVTDNIISNVISNLNDIQKFIYMKNSHYQNTLATHAELVGKLQNDINKKDIDIINLDSNNIELKLEIERNHIEIKELRQTITNLEEENFSYRKVSQIIALENENARLKKESEMLKKKMIKDEIHDVVSNLEINVLHDNMSIQEDVSIEDDIDVFEKTIKGITYYVTNDEHKRVFEMGVDGSIGVELGYLDVVGKRTKLILH